MSVKAFSWLLLVAALVAGVIGLVRLNRVTLPEGPRPVVWDREVCAHCKMHIGDPRFAAQLQTTDGDVLSFDDPGCLFDYVSAHPVSPHAMYFRDHDGSGWLSKSEVGFLPTDESPMGYGIQAVSKDVPGAKGFAWAERRVREQREERNGGT